jgi:uncharacterized protein (DUF305 family)
MTKSTAKVAAALATAVLAAIALTGCAANTGMGDHSMNHSSETTSAYTADDIMFMQMMIPHHQQAVDMGTLAETRALNPEVKALAAQIKAEQALEIASMTKWLKEAGASIQMDHTMNMDGMLTEDQMKALENASGAEFDRLYLEGMIAHHEGAIEMAKTATNSKTPNTHELGHSITDSQSEQITLMKELLAKL